MHRDTIERRLIEIVAAAMDVEATTIDPTLSFDAMGLDSMAKVSIVPSLERQFGCSLDSQLLFDCPDLPALATHIEFVLNSME